MLCRMSAFSAAINFRRRNTIVQYSSQNLNDSFIDDLSFINSEQSEADSRVLTVPVTYFEFGPFQILYVVHLTPNIVLECNFSEYPAVNHILQILSTL